MAATLHYTDGQTFLAAPTMTAVLSYRVPQIPAAVFAAEFAALSHTTATPERLVAVLVPHRVVSHDVAVYLSRFLCQKRAPQRLRTEPWGASLDERCVAMFGRFVVRSAATAALAILFGGRCVTASLQPLRLALLSPTAPTPAGESEHGFRLTSSVGGTSGGVSLSFSDEPGGLPVTAAAVDAVITSIVRTTATACGALPAVEAPKDWSRPHDSDEAEALDRQREAEAAAAAQRAAKAKKKAAAAKSKVSAKDAAKARRRDAAEAMRYLRDDLLVAPLCSSTVVSVTVERAEFLSDAALAAIPRSIPTLRVLRLHDSACGPLTAAALQKSTVLRSLSTLSIVRARALTDPALGALLATAANVCPHLTSLAVRFVVQAASATLHALTSLRSLEVLDVMGNAKLFDDATSIDADTGEEVGTDECIARIAALPHLTSLNVRGCHLRPPRLDLLRRSARKSLAIVV